MKKLRWGVIGAGGIADRRTIPGMMLAKNAELIAVMDINAEQVEKIRQKYGAKRGYTKEEDLLADPEVDAVYIATPIVLHLLPCFLFGLDACFCKTIVTAELFHQAEHIGWFLASTDDKRIKEIEGDNVCLLDFFFQNLIHKSLVPLCFHSISAMWNVR